MTAPASPFSLVVKPVGAACNLSCDYCFYMDKAALYPHGPAVMPPDVLRRTLATYLAQPFDSFSITFQGGEPLLAGLDFYRLAASVVRDCARAGASVRLSIQTNATLMTREAARFFADERWLVGVSVDGPAAMHDLHRRSPCGDGSHADVMRGLDALRDAGAEYNALCLVTQGNVRDPKAVYRYLRDEARAVWHQYSLDLEAISLPEWDAFLCGILDAWTADGDAGRVYVRNIEDAIIYARTGIAAQCIFADRCDGHLVVERNGDVYPCDFFVSAATRLGNIMDSDWDALRESPPALRLASAKCRRHLSRIATMRFYERIALLA